MIIIETLNGFKHTYSDAGFCIRQIQTGAVYEDAMDLPDAKYTYEETDTPIAVPEEPLQ